MGRRRRRWPRMPAATSHHRAAHGKGRRARDLSGIHSLGFRRSEVRPIVPAVRPPWTWALIGPSLVMFKEVTRRSRLTACCIARPKGYTNQTRVQAQFAA
jgi:hypothetical protein